MFDRAKALFEDVGLKAKVWNRERKERAEEKQAARAHDVHAHSRFWLLNVPALATVCAAIVEWYWAMLFCIEATGQLGFDWSTSTGSDVAATGAWHFIFDIQNMAVLLGLVAATIPIVMLSMVWLPVQFAMRGAGAWRRGTIIAVGLLANILVIVSGTVVMNYNRQDQVRETAVVEQTAQQGRAAIDARLAFEQEQLRLALNNTNPYLNQAANVGAAEWERSYVAQARASNDPRLPMLERALGAARAADARRANIERLTIERAQAAPEAATAANVEDNVGRELNTFAQYVEVWRPPFVAFICTLIGIFGAWWTLAMLERLNPKDVLRSGWADDKHRIEDLREQDPIASNPASMQTVMEEEDLETGEKKRRITPKPYWRTVKRGEKKRIEVPPEMLPDEEGVYQDGGNRAGTSVPVEEGVDELSASEQPAVSEAKEEGHHGEQDEQLVPHGSVAASHGNVDDEAEHSAEPSEELPIPDFSADEEINEELAAESPVDAPNANTEEHASEEPDQQAEQEIASADHTEPREEPETDPAKLIAAE